MVMTQIHLLDKKTQTTRDSVGIEVQNAINDGYVLECEPQGVGYYLVKEEQSNESSLSFGEIISWHADLLQEQIVYRVVLSDGRRARYNFNWAESYSIDGGY